MAPLAEDGPVVIPSLTTRSTGGGHLATTRIADSLTSERVMHSLSFGFVVASRCRLRGGTYNTRPHEWAPENVLERIRRHFPAFFVQAG
jgi:hypothetical protein